VLQPPSSNPTRDFLWGSSQVTEGHCRIFQDFFCNPALEEFEVHAWDHCPVGRSNNTQASASSLTAWPRISWYFNEFISPSTCCRFPVPEDAMQSSPRASQCTTMLNCRPRVLFQHTLHSSSSRHIGPKSSSFVSSPLRTESQNPFYMTFTIYMILSKLMATFLLLLGQ